MAVPEQTPYIEHTGNGVTTSFSLGFQCESKDHLIVLVDDIEPPIATWSLNGGNVVFTTAPAAGKKITLQRNTSFGRTTNYQSFNNSFRPQTVNIDFDRIWWKLQELGVADWLMKLYVDRLHQQQEEKINDLKGYVDDRDDELRAYLMEEIRKQGVALDQLDDYYNYLMQRLAQIAVDKGWDASFVVDASGKTQQEINDGLESIAELRNINPPRKGLKVYVKSHTADTGQGGGWFVATQNSELVDDDGLIISSLNPLIFWRRIVDNNTYQPEFWGACGDGINDDTVAIQAALEYARRYSLEPEKPRVLFATKKYRFTAQLNMSRCAIESHDADLLKDFSGVGVLVAGGARYTDFYGDLIISGHGEHFTDGYSPTIDAESHGIQFSGRFKIHGSVLSRNHWGHGVLIDAYSNMNKCSVNFLKADYNAGKGIYGKSINNDCSVWTIKTETYGNYNGGVYLEDTFSGRQWDWNCYNEASRNPDMEAGVYWGRFRRSVIFIYSEEQATTNPELVIGAACEDLDINDTRNNRTVNNAPLTCVTRKGYVPQYRSGGAEVTIQDRVLVGLSNAVGARVNFLTLGGANKSFLRDVYTGNGGWSRSAYNPDAPTGASSSLGVYADRVSLHGYGQSLGALVYIRDANGTQDLPTQKASGEYACNLVGSIYTGTTYTDAYRIRARLATVGTGNKASTDLEFGAATSAGGVSSTMILKSNGTLDVAAGITPFTGMHKAISATKLESGMAVDVVDVVNNIMTVELSKTANSKRCAGVVNHCELLDDGSYLVYVAAVGDSHTTQLTGLKVTDEGGDIEVGDILVTASEPGYLCKAADGLHESVTRFKAMQDAVFIENKAEIYGYFK